jgi:hypothetical protein
LCWLRIKCIHQAKRLIVQEEDLEMSKFQLQTIQEVLGFDIKQAENLIQLMDTTGDHPDWSEFSNTQFRKHFKMVLAGF